MNKLVLLLALACAAAAPAATEKPEPPAPASPAPAPASVASNTPSSAIPAPVHALAHADGLALVGGRVVTMAGHTYPNGTVLIAKDKIVAVGGADVDVPGRYEVVDVKGLEIYPGFIESNSQLGLIEVDEESVTRDVDEDTDTITPHVKAEDGINVRSELIPVTRLNGITTALVSPGESNLFSGQSAIVDLAGESVQEMIVKSPAFLHLNLGNESRDRGRSKGKFATRMGQMAEVREQFLKAQEYRRHLERYKEELEIFEQEQKDEEKDEKKEEKKEDKKDEKKDAGSQEPRKEEDKKPDKPKKKQKKLPPEPPGRELKMEPLVAALKGELQVFVRANREDDIRHALALMREFNLKIVLNHVADGWRVAPLLVENGVFASVGPINTQPDNWETLGARYDNAALLARAGVTIAIQTGEAHNVRNLPFFAGLASAHGLARDEALAAITIDAARVLGISDRYGSIEKGKVANLVVVDGDPLQPASRLRHLFIRGREVALKSHQTQLYDKFKSR